jgi:hypothetical protein
MNATIEGTPMQVTGKCHCGKIAYEAKVMPSTVVLCHCTDCQALTGCAYRVSVGAQRADFKLLAGAPKIYIKTTDDGSQRAMHFCGDCGSPLYSSEVGDQGATIVLRTGCLQERAQLIPSKQIWFRSAMPWASNLEGIPHLEKD